jgi:hypothetical protein
VAEYKASETYEEITPEERQRRLGQVYGLLITLARRKRVEQGQPGELSRAIRKNASVVGG